MSKSKSQAQDEGQYQDKVDLLADDESDLDEDEDIQQAIEDDDDDNSSIITDSDDDEGEGAENDHEREEEQDEGEETDDDGEEPKKAEIKLKDVATLKSEIQESVELLSDWTNGKKRTKLPHHEVREGFVKACAQYYGYSDDLATYLCDMFSASEAVQLFEANEKQRPMTIRTNTLKSRRRLLAQHLTTRGATVESIGDWTKVGLTVKESPVPIGATPEYLSGQYMLQAASSFIPVMALAPQPGETVLDMSAAPGGKTTYIGQLMENRGVLFANDLKEDRCKSLVANIHRLGLTNTVVTCGDGAKLKSFLPKLDRVLLDAPCSGSGIVARDGSVKLRRGLQDFVDQSHVQKQLLLAAIDMIDANSRTGGYVVYSTCSISIEENESVIDSILKARNVKVVPFDMNVDGLGTPGFTKFKEKRFHDSLKHAKRYYPHVHNMDGFFVCKLNKTSNDIPQRVKKDRRPIDISATWDETTLQERPELASEVLSFEQDSEEHNEEAPTATAAAAEAKNAASKEKTSLPSEGKKQKRKLPEGAKEGDRKSAPPAFKKKKFNKNGNAGRKK